MRWPLAVRMLATPLFLVAFASDAQSGSTRALIWIGALIAVTFMGGFIILAIRRRLLSKSGAADDASSLFDQLRAMRDRGQMTNEEFEAARRSMREKLTR